MGGLAYVNTGYLILNSEVIPKEHKEASINMSLCINSFGILVAACFCLILDNFIITN
jgi:CLN3 protein.